jgi:Ulp1 family protease
MFKNVWERIYLHNEIQNFCVQENGNDCGVFHILHVSYMSNATEFDFTQKEIEEKRWTICYNILKNRIW